MRFPSFSSAANCFWKVCSAPDAELLAWLHARSGTSMRRIVLGLGIVTLLRVLFDLRQGHTTSGLVGAVAVGVELSVALCLKCMPLVPEKFFELVMLAAVVASLIGALTPLLRAEDGADVTSFTTWVANACLTKSVLPSLGVPLQFGLLYLCWSGVMDFIGIRLLLSQMDRDELLMYFLPVLISITLMYTAFAILASNFVTALYESELEMKSQKHTLEAISTTLESFCDSVVQFDQDLSLSGACAKFMHILHHPSSDGEGKVLSQFIKTPDDARRLRRELHNKPCGMDTAKVDFVDADGVTVEARLFFTKYESTDGRIRYIAGINETSERQRLPPTRKRKKKRRGHSRGDPGADDSGKPPGPEEPSEYDSVEEASTNDLGFEAEFAAMISPDVPWRTLRVTPALHERCVASLASRNAVDWFLASDARDVGQLLAQEKERAANGLRLLPRKIEFRHVALQPFVAEKDFGADGPNAKLDDAFTPYLSLYIDGRRPLSPSFWFLLERNAPKPDPKPAPHLALPMHDSSELQVDEVHLYDRSGEHVVGLSPSRAKKSRDPPEISDETSLCTGI